MKEEAAKLNIQEEDLLIRGNYRIWLQNQRFSVAPKGNLTNLNGHRKEDRPTARE